MNDHIHTGTSFWGKLKSIVVILVSIVLLGITINNSGIHVSDLQLSLKQWVYLLLSMVVFYLTIFTQSIRARIPWRPLWKSAKPINTFNSLALGNFYNCVLPGNLGEAVRVWHLSRKNKVSFINSLAAHGVEKYTDAYAFVSYLILLVLLFKGLSNAYPLVFLFAGAVLIVLLTYLFVLLNRKAEKLVAAILFRFTKAGKWLYRVHYHLKFLLKKMTAKSLTEYMVIGYSLFFFNILQYYLVMCATGIEEPILSVPTAILVATGMVVVSLLPSAPGNIGVLHYGIYTLLVFVYKAKTGVDADASHLQKFGVFTIYLHLSYFLPEILLGLMVLIKERHRLL